MAAAVPGGAAAGSGAPGGGATAPRAPPRPVMLLLVGVPGSGKSTLSGALVARSKAPGAPARWVAVNQVRGAGRDGDLDVTALHPSLHHQGCMAACAFALRGAGRAGPNPVLRRGRLLQAPASSGSGAQAN
jgi:hypothetical protein